MKKVLLTATVQSHIAQFHKPLINMLKENGYEVHVAARDNLVEKNGLKLDYADKIFNIPFDRSPLSKNNLLAFYTLKKILSKNKYDVVHCNTPMGSVVTRLATNKFRKSGTKVFYTAHGFHFYKGAPVKNWLFYYPIEKMLAKYTDKLITITKEDFRLARDRFKTEVLHTHGVGANSDKYYEHDEKEKKQALKELGYSPEQFIILCIGELNHNKNQKTIIQAFTKVSDIIPSGKLLLAGNGPLEGSLKNQVRENNIVERVDFLGYRTDLEKYLSVSDLVMSASVREGLPLNVIEAMLSGKPVVVSDNRGHRELIEENLNGLINDPYDVDAFAESIVKFYKDRNFKRTVIDNSLKISTKYSSNYVIKDLKEIYEL